MNPAEEESFMNVGAEAGPSTSPSLMSPLVLGANPEGMSKNQMKKANRKAKLLATRPEKRAAERARKRERDAQRKEGYAAGTLSAQEMEVYEKRKALKKARIDDAKKTKKDVWKGGVIIDLGFDDMMRDPEIASMASQLGFLYSANRTSERPFGTILQTSFGPSASPRLWEVMKGRDWARWNRMVWREQGLEEVSKAFSQLPAGAEKGVEVAAEEDLAKVPGEGVGQAEPSDAMRALSGPVLPSTITSSHKLVYLSADSEEELTTLSEDEVYIVGGIVDRNRYKMLCQDKAVKLGIRTARLPIGTYLAEMPTRKVLTVNQVVEILLQYVNLKDWSQAFHAVIPKRKYDAVGKRELRRRERAVSKASNPAQSEAGDKDDHDSQDEEMVHGSLEGDEVPDKDTNM